MHSHKLQQPLLEQLQLCLSQNSRPPELSEARFNEAHECFERSSDQQFQILNWLKRFTKDRLNSRNLNVLSVGCGSGILDNPFLKALVRHSVSVRYVGIDPSAVACQRFWDDFRELQLERAQLELHQQTLETFQTSDSFDLIHSVQSLYYVDDPSVALNKLFKKLTPEGFLVVMLAPKGAMNKLAEAFWEVSHHDGIWFSARFEKYLSRAGIVYEKKRLSAWLNITPCFEMNSRHGALLLDFITQADCSHLTKGERDLCHLYLKAIVRQEANQLFIPHPVDVFVLRSSSC